MSNLKNLSDSEINEKIAVKAAQEGFPEFCIATDNSYQLKWFHEKIAFKLEEVYQRVKNGESPRIMIFMPPRHGKSELATQKFPAWILGKEPQWPMIVSSYSTELATDFGQNTRDIMQSDEYKSKFDTRLRSDTTAKGKWKTQEGGGYTSVGVGGSITGRGFKIGIIDDPYKNRDEANSEVIRDKVWSWYRSTFETREEGDGAIIVILTRWHDDDLAGRLIQEQKENEKEGVEHYDEWEILEFKALAEYDEEHRNEGQVLWPEKFSQEKIQRKRTTLGPYEFSALYQQSPIDEESQEFKSGWFKTRSWKEVSKMDTRVFLTIDPRGANKKIEGQDYIGIALNFVDIQGKWNLMSWREKLNGTELADLLFRLHIEYNIEQIGIEKTQFSEGLEPYVDQEMDKRGVYLPIEKLSHRSTMKEVRIRGLVPRYERGGVYHIVRDGRNTCEDLEQELIRFPRAVNDDASDATAYQSDIAEKPYPEETMQDDFGLYSTHYG